MICLLKNADNVREQDIIREEKLSNKFHTHFLRSKLNLWINRKIRKSWYVIIILSIRACNSVDRVSDSGPDGRGFNSRHAYKNI